MSHEGHMTSVSHDCETAVWTVWLWIGRRQVGEDRCKAVCCTPRGLHVVGGDSCLTTE